MSKVEYAQEPLWRRLAIAGTLSALASFLLLVTFGVAAIVWGSGTLGGLSAFMLIPAVVFGVGTVFLWLLRNDAAADDRRYGREPKAGRRGASLSNYMP